MEWLLGRGWFWLGIGSALVVGTTGCALGIRSSHGHNASAERTLTTQISETSVTGTVEESARTSQLVAAGLIRVGPLSVLEIGASFGVRTLRFEPEPGALEALQGDDGYGFHDAYFVGVSKPLTGWYDLNIGVYGYAQLTGFARMMPGSSGTYALEGGVEADLPTGEKRNRIYVRAGLALDRGNYELEAGGDGRAIGSTSFVGITTAIGVRLWGDR